MFDAVLEQQDRRSRRVTRLVIASLVLHAGLLALLWINDLLKVEAVPEPSVSITFVDFIAAPPPPPPPPPKKHAAQRRPDAPKPMPKEFVAPKEIPKEAPKPAEASNDDAADEGPDEPGAEEGGVEGGVAGGVVGGVAPEKPAAKIEEPAPVFMEERFVRERRISGDEPAYPSAALRDEIEGVVLAKVVIGPDGRVTEVIIQQGHPVFERSVRESVMGWRFRPQTVDGRLVTTYTTFRFIFRLE